jgi:hypothetical protein
MREEIKSRLNFSNAFYYWVQNLLSSCLLFKNIKICIYETIILPVILYGCETWSLTLREEHRLKVFENRVLRRIFGPKGDEMVGGCRKLHNEELYNLYSSPDIVRIIKSRRMRWAGHVACMGRKGIIYICVCVWMRAFVRIVLYIFCYCFYHYHCHHPFLRTFFLSLFLSLYYTSESYKKEVYLSCLV